MSTTAAPAAPALPSHVLGYRALKLWQRALDLAADAHRLAHAFPEADQAALAADLRRAAVGVPAAIAASSMAFDRADQHRALQAAAAALARLETTAALAERLGVLAAGDATAFLFTSGDVTRLLRGLTRSIVARTAVPEAGTQTADAASAPPPVQRVAEPAPKATIPITAAVDAVSPASPPSMRATARRRSAARPSARAVP